MPVVNTTIDELKINKKPQGWICRFQTNFDDGRIKRVKLPVSEADMTAYEGTPAIPAVYQYVDENDEPIDPPILISPEVPAVPPDPTALDGYKTTAETHAVEQIKQQDAYEGINANDEVTANREATAKERAVAYLRKAWKQRDAYDAYLLFDKFNNYRLAQGWNLNQVAAGLAEAGLTAEEWEDIKTAYQYLSAGQRPNEMAAARVIQDNWEGRNA